MTEEGTTSDDGITAPADVSIVALGASAGALQAVGDFLATVPADAPFAFVVVHHTDPDHRSLMAELLARRTPLPVVEAAEGTRVEAGHVYVIPPGRYLALAGDALALSPPDAGRGPRLPIDHFLRSLATGRGHRAVAVILTGTGADGSGGIAAIAEQGGLVLAQDPLEAAHDGMPRSAIATGVVDHVLPIARMAEVILRFGRHPYVAERESGPVAGERVRAVLPAIVARLRAHSSIDFELYKEGTLLRRIERRMALRHLRDPHDYLALLEESAEERARLIDDLLINVTAFFRDPEAFAHLADRVRAELLPRIPDGRALRVWVPGCASGEEAYTLAMVLSEVIGEAQRDVRLQIFASDIDERALGTARVGLYPETIEANVSSARRERFFVREDHLYRVAPELRECIVFAAHDVLADAPFSRLDLISCRNLLIYLDARGQQRALDLFHFALNEEGLLLLGTSESVGEEGRGHLFERVAGAQRLYRRGAAPQRRRLELGLGAHEGVRSASPGTVAPDRPARLAELARELLVERYAPAAALVDARLNVLFTHGASDRYLRVAPGAASQDLTAMYRGEARTRLGGTVRRALREGHDVTVRDALVRDGARVAIGVTAHPVPGETGLALVAFDDRAANGFGDGETADGPDGDEPARRGLEAELDATREDLRRVVEEFERSSEELRAVNEESMSLNEEFRSTNEELETSKEELQSLNEELTTLNTELQLKVDEERRVSADLDNLLSSSGVATLFLDRERRITRFTPAVRTLFSVIATDVGRPLADIVSRVVDPEFDADARAVLGGAAPIEREVSSGGARWFTRRVLPYRSRGDGIEGLVVTFQDVTDLKALEQAGASARRLAESIVDTVREPMLVLDAALHVLAANSAFHAVFGTRAEEVGDVELSALPGEGWKDADLRARLRAVLGGGAPLEAYELEPEAAGNDARRIRLDARPIVDESDGPPRLLLALEDITEETARREELDRAQRMEAIGQLTGGIAHDFNNLLTVIGGNLELLDATLAGRSGRELLDEAREATALGAELTGQLLAFSRRQTLAPRPVDLNALVLATLPLLQRPLGETIAVTTALADDLPPTLADPGRIENVLLNLALNAAQAMPDGGTLRIATRGVSIEPGDAASGAGLVSGPYVALSVEDSGTGMTERVREHAFEPFFTTRGKAGGSGLGLSMVYGFARQSGGHVAIDTARGRGTTVTLYLPRSPAAPDAPAEGDRGDVPPSGGETVLVVEDDPHVRRVTLRRLSALGYAVLSAENAREAIDVLESRSDIALVFSDVVMPGPLSGFDVAEHAAGLDPAPKVLLTSGYPDDPRAAAGGFEILGKPYGLDELARALRARLDG